MSYLYYSFLFAFLYVYAGLGLTLLLCPEALKKHALFLAPMAGYCYLTLAAWLCYRLNLRGTDAYGAELLVPPAFFLYYALTSRKKQATQEYKLINRELIAPIAIGIIALAIISTPFVTTNVESLTSKSLRNADIAANDGVSRYLKEFARSETVDFLGDKANEFRYVPHVYFGPCLSTALPSSLFSLQTYQLQNISIHIFFVFSVLLLYSLAREVFRYSQYGAIGVTALYGLSPIMYYTINECFVSQIIATGLAICLILLNVKAIDSSHRISDYYSYAPLVALFTWGMLVSYRHMLPLLYVPLACYVLLTAIYAKSRTVVTNWLLFLVVTVAAAAVFSPIRLISLATYLIFQGNVPVGWHIPLITPEGVFGLTFNDVYLQMPFTNVALSVLLAVVIGAGFVHAYKTDRRLFLLALSLVGLIILGYLILAIPDRTAGGWGGYKSYKFLSFFLPQVLLGSLLLFRSLQFAPKKRIYYLLNLPLAALIGCSIVSCRAMVNEMSNTRFVVSKDLADLRRVEDDTRVESVNILRSDYWQTLWQANFLMRKKLYFENTTYYAATTLDGQWDLKPPTMSANDIIHVTDFDIGKNANDPSTLTVNSSYVLERVGPIRTLDVRFEKGWHNSEGAHIWTGESSEDSTITLQCPKDKVAIDFRAIYWPLDPNNHLSIILNGIKVAECPDNHSCEALGLILSQGQNVLTFKTALPAAIPGNGDPRHLGYAFNSINISPSKTQVLAQEAPTPKK